MTKHVQLSLPNFLPPAAPRPDTRVTMAMFVLESPCLRDFASPLGVCAYNVGLVVESYLEQKILEIGLRRYGSIVAPAHARQNAVLVHPHGSDWRLKPLPDPLLNPLLDPKAAALLAQLPAGAYRDGIITFRLDHALRIVDVETEFQKRLGSRNLNTFLESPSGRERLVKANLPADARLFTDYEQFGPLHRSLASKIYVVRPQHELAILLQALVQALAIRH